MKRLGWLGCCVATFAFAGSAVAVAAPPPTLTNEQFLEAAGSAGGGCDLSTASFSFEGSGAASGPYAGTFAETGGFTIVAQRATVFGAGFTIFSATHEVSVKGTMALDPAAPSSGCIRPPSRHYLVDLGATYVATIFRPSGNYRDQGRANVEVGADASGSLTLLIERFTSSLAEPILIVPTTKRHCKRGGWRDYPQFKNQGRCVRFVVTGKPPGQAGRTSRPGRSKAHGQGNHSKAPK